VRDRLYTHTHINTHIQHEKGHLGQSGRNSPGPKIQKVRGAVVPK